MTKLKEKRFEGIGVSHGVVIGKVFIFDIKEDVVLSHAVEGSKMPQEIARLETALIKTRRQIFSIREQIAQKMGIEHAEIFSAHLLVLEDRTLIEEVIRRLEKEKNCVEYVFQQVIKDYIKTFSGIRDEYLRDRAADVSDVGRRVLHNLTGIQREDLSQLDEEVVVIANDLSPSDTALMHKEKVIAFATDVGGRTSHTAIMARSLEIPAVVGLHNVSQRIKTGDTIIVDGNRGVVIVHPTRKTLNEYTREKDRLLVFEHKLEELKDLPAQTIDGHRIKLSANIEMPEDVNSVLSHGADGIGLYRTEFFYMNRADLPTEDEHCNAYINVAERVYPNEVIIRTLDLGGDKFASHLELPREMNPFMGWRAIRFCLENLDIFKVQLRAILRASIKSNIKMMYPMISGVEELIRANEVLEEVKEDLKSQEIPFNEAMEVGAMIEVPAAALTADLIAPHVDFFSIGTNDLIQYSLAVDRVNENVAYLYQPTHPGVLRLIDRIIRAGHDQGIWVGMCGEMAGDPAMTLILLGLGLDELSTSAVSVSEVKKAIRSVTFSAAKKLVHDILKYQSAEKIRRKAQKLLTEIAPELVLISQEKAKRRKRFRKSP